MSRFIFNPHKVLGSGNAMIMLRSSNTVMDDNITTVQDEITNSKNRIKTLENYFESGSAKKATKLNTARKIGNASFDGSSDITLEQMGAAPIKHKHNDEDIISVDASKIKGVIPVENLTATALTWNVIRNE